MESRMKLLVLILVFGTSLQVFAEEEDNNTVSSEITNKTSSEVLAEEDVLFYKITNKTLGVYTQVQTRRFI